jgi:hypothetical protein
VKEAEWMASDNPSEMLAHVADKISPRRLRLFAIACCRLMLPHWGQTSVSAARSAAAFVEAAVACEAWADGGVPPESRVDDYWFYIMDRNASRAAQSACREAAQERYGPFGLPAWAAALLRDIVGNPFRPVTLPKVPTYPAAMMPGGRWVRHGTNEEAAHCPWRTPTVLSLAQAAYEQRERKCQECLTTWKPLIVPCRMCGSVNGGMADYGSLDPARLFVLSDALEEAGADGEILAHLRSLGPHYRGCWALDLIVGKS